VCIFFVEPLADSGCDLSSADVCLCFAKDGLGFANASDSDSVSVSIFGTVIAFSLLLTLLFFLCHKPQDIRHHLLSFPGSSIKLEDLLLLLKFSKGILPLNSHRRLEEGLAWLTALYKPFNNILPSASHRALLMEGLVVFDFNSLHAGLCHSLP
jgi:hypothetical protein